MPYSYQKAKKHDFHTKNENHTNLAAVCLILNSNTEGETRGFNDIAKAFDKFTFRFWP